MSGLNDRRIEEGRGMDGLADMGFRTGDVPERLIGELRNRLAGASAEDLVNKFPGLTPEKAAEALHLSLTESPDGVQRQFSLAELQFVKSVTDLSRLVQVACMLGGLKYKPDAAARCLDMYDISARCMNLTPGKLAVINSMQDPVHLTAPGVSMKYLYTVFLPKILKACGQDSEVGLDDNVLQVLDEQDAQFGLTDEVGFWYGFFVDRMVYAGGSAGKLDDSVASYPKSGIGKDAAIVNPIQYAILLATEIIRTYFSGENEVAFDRYARTLLSMLDGKLLIGNGDAALIGSWGDAIGSFEAPSLEIVSSKSNTSGLIFRPAVSTI